MEIKEVAKIMDGNEYMEEMKGINESKLIADGIVVAFGYSDDNIEFRGAINDELGCYGGGKFFLTSGGILENKCDAEDCPYFEQMLKRSESFVDALWCDEEDYSWTLYTKLPHASFDIMEDGDKYCRGIVFKLSDVK